MPPVTVICAKWGDRYSADYVNRLKSMVTRNLTIPHRFVCFTDSEDGLDSSVEARPMPEVRIPPPRNLRPWRKVALFQNPLADVEGTVLFLDLDVVITGNIDCFFEHPGEFCVILNWTVPSDRVGNTSVFRFQAGAHADILEYLEANHTAIETQFRNSQTFVSRQLGDNRLTFWPDAWCRSFKVHCIPKGPLRYALTPRLPQDCRIVAFHGKPDPHDAVTGYHPKLWRRFRPTPWVTEHWR